LAVPGLPCRPAGEQRWSTYAISLLAFSAVSVLVVYAVQRSQGVLALNPDGQAAVTPALSFNTAVSFVTNTNWQSYVPEATVSTLTQVLALAVQNVVSPAVGMAVAVALIRGLTRARAGTIGNFWVDLTRSVVRVLLPLSLVLAVVLVSQGVVQNLSGAREVTTVEGSAQQVPGGMVASQEAIKELGTNGGGYFNANSAHPFENPNGFTNLLEMWAILAIPFSLPFAYGRLVAAASGNRRDGARQGRVVFAAMFALWLAAVVGAMVAETSGNDRLAAAGVTQEATAEQAGGNAEGKETRFGPAGCGMFAATTTGTSTGAVNCMHDSMTPLGGAVPLVNMMLGEVSPGGVGAGLYGLLVFVLLAVFLAGLMVGRTPEYLGKKVQATEMKLVVLYLLFVPLVVLGFAGASAVLEPALASQANPGPHGLTELVYAYTSAGNNNGSAFAGLAADTDWFNTTLGIAMLVGRFGLIIPVLAIAGSLAGKQTVPPSVGTFPTGTPLFTTLLVGVVVIVVGLTYAPVLALGPVVEHLSGGV
jgi:K+-transporting ATPase ATPase A chain